MWINTNAQLVEIEADSLLGLIVPFNDDIRTFPVVLPGHLILREQDFIKGGIRIRLLCSVIVVHQLAMMLGCSDYRIGCISRGIHHNNLFGCDRFSDSQFSLQFDAGCGIRVKDLSTKTWSLSREIYRLQQSN